MKWSGLSVFRDGQKVKPSSSTDFSASVRVRLDMLWMMEFVLMMGCFLLFV